MKTTFKKVTLTVLFMITVAVLTFIGCKKTVVNTDVTPEELKGFEADIKAQIAKLPEREKMPTQIFNEKIPVTTFLADENNNPLPAGTAPGGTPAACNFTTPAYCNLIQYARAYVCNTSGSINDDFYLQFTYELSWDNSIYIKKTKGYLKIYDAVTNALVVDEIISHYNKIDVTDMGADPFNAGNNIYRVVFSCPTIISSAIVNSGTAYNVFTSALFGTTCSNGTDYLVGSAAVTATGFTGASSTDPCKRNDKIVFMGLASSGLPNPTYAPSASTYTYLTNSCSYTSTFIIPDIVEVWYSLDGGANWINSMTGSQGSYQNYLKYHDPINGGGITFTSGSVLTSGTYNLVFRYRNWKYGDPARINSYPFTIPGTSPVPFDCTNIGNGTSGSGYTYYYYGNVTIP